jgi:hypothetical protein
MDIVVENVIILTLPYLPWKDVTSVAETCRAAMAYCTDEVQRRGREWERTGYAVRWNKKRVEEDFEGKVFPLTKLALRTRTIKFAEYYGKRVISEILLDNKKMLLPPFSSFRLSELWEMGLLNALYTDWTTKGKHRISVFGRIVIKEGDVNLRNLWEKGLRPFTFADHIVALASGNFLSLAKETEIFGLQGLDMRGRETSTLDIMRDHSAGGLAYETLFTSPTFKDIAMGTAVMEWIWTSGMSSYRILEVFKVLIDCGWKNEWDHNLIHPTGEEPIFNNLNKLSIRAWEWEYFGVAGICLYKLENTLNGSNQPKGITSRQHAAINSYDVGSLASVCTEHDTTILLKLGIDALPYLARRREKVRSYKLVAKWIKDKDYYNISRWKQAFGPLPNEILPMCARYGFILSEEEQKSEEVQEMRNLISKRKRIDNKIHKLQKKRIQYIEDMNKLDYDIKNTK